ncbi:hypothetical protein ElyMa_006063800 [Elysia marginata]|uniref:Uncharacterized protein n=1 Tax=Elysia marginata TaxID=1093978 RepID=A0AAV4GM64_9GAST|nr:hypothetical protein ElyMa_006063800 [Elysia marginata]
MALKLSLQSSKISVFVISAVILGVTNVCLASQASDSDMSETLNYLRNKVDTLDSKLDILLERTEVKANASSESAGEQASEGTEEVIARPAQLISAQRIPLNGSGNRFIIRLKNTTEGEITARIFGDGGDRGLFSGEELVRVNCGVDLNKTNLFFKIKIQIINDATTQ